jgi:hypothetical protein
MQLEVKKLATATISESLKTYSKWLERPLKNKTQFREDNAWPPVSSCSGIPNNLRQFDDVMIYLKSIQQFFEADDDFIWNYAITLAATGDYKQAEEYFLKIQSEKYRLEDCYNRWLTRCYIMNGKTNLAWELYVNMETNNESIYLL